VRVRSIKPAHPIEGGQTCRRRRRAHHAVDVERTRLEAAMAAAARSAIRSSQNPGGRS